MISHRNVIAEVLLLKLYDSHVRKEEQRDVVLGLLPFSHIYGLSVFTAAIYRGDTVVVLPKFELNTLLAAIQRTGLNVLYLVSRYFPYVRRRPFAADTVRCRSLPSWSRW